MENLKSLKNVGLLGAVLVILIFALLWLPEWMVNQYQGKPLSRLEYTNAVDEYRKTLAQIIGGFAILVGLYFTWRTTKTAEDGRITDRFSKAVEQLGATSKEGAKQIEPRLGGIYSLERIATDSKRDAKAIIEILCAYVRENSPRKYAECDPETFAPTGPDPQRIKVGTDVQAILRILSNFRPQFRNDPSLLFDLNTTELYQADLSNAVLDGGDFHRAYLERAEMSKINLESADLSGAYMMRGKLSKANLRNASLYRANLVNADLYGADLQGANLSEANLTRANLKNSIMGLVRNSSTNLRETNLKGANLAGVDLSFVSGLSAEQILSAQIDERTVLPIAVKKEMVSRGIPIPYSGQTGNPSSASA
jgi:hypothetical protein